jgi:hypothetical protein
LTPEEARTVPAIASNKLRSLKALRVLDTTRDEDEEL